MNDCGTVWDLCVRITIFDALLFLSWLTPPLYAIGNAQLSFETGQCLHRYSIQSSLMRHVKETDLGSTAEVMTSDSLYAQNQLGKPSWFQWLQMVWQFATEYEDQLQEPGFYGC